MSNYNDSCVYNVPNYDYNDPSVYNLADDDDPHVAFAWKYCALERDRENFKIADFMHYFIDISRAFNTLDIETFPEIVETRPVESLRLALARIRDIPDNDTLIRELLRNPFRSLTWDMVEEVGLPYADQSRVPVIYGLWKDWLLPRVFAILRVSWPTIRLNREELQEMAKILLTTVHHNDWPMEYLEPAEECMICQESCITRKFVMNCGHWSCHDCQMNWLAQSNTCPMCRRLVFWDG